MTEILSFFFSFSFVLWVAILSAYVLAEAGQRVEALVLHDEMNVWQGITCIGWMGDGHLRE